MTVRGHVSFHSLFEILAATHWVSAPGFRVTAAGIVGVTGLILALRDGRIRNFPSFTWYLEGDDSRDRLWLVPGLQNLGNNCFLNVILQALASCSYFQGFLRTTVEEIGASLEEGRVGSMPLAVALDALLEELSTVRHQKAVLSPRKLMLAMAQYIPNFNLSSQQDAEEAFFHILSSIREEISEVYALNLRSLAEVTALTSCRILTPKSSVLQTEQKRWSQNFLGPFDGILGSILTCQTCSFQISGCSVEDCMMKFFAAEQLESYSCTHCWHTAAMKYLSLIDKNESNIEKLRCCTEQDSCDCKNIQRIGALPWSNGFSRTFKQLHVARGPKILCLHLQRASMNIFGEQVKLEGHISFPLILNMSPFLKSDVEITDCQRNMRNELATEPCQLPLHSHYLKMQHIINPGKSASAEEGADKVCGQSPTEVLGERIIEAVQKEEPTLADDGYCSDTMPYSTQRQPKSKLDGSWNGLDNYHLVSVVEHFGSSGNGHYTVYRRVGDKLNNGGCGRVSVSSPVHWFCVSDSQVQNVSEKDVLAAEASMLFYEKVQEC